MSNSNYKTREEKKECMIIISNKTELHRLKVDDIICVEADGNYSHIRLTNGDELTVCIQLGAIKSLIAAQLDETDCTLNRISHSLIVNMDYVRDITLQNQKLTLMDRSGRTVKVSASAKSLKSLKESFDCGHFC